MMFYNDKQITSKLKILVARITFFGIPSSTGGKKKQETSALEPCKKRAFNAYSNQKITIKFESLKLY